MMHRKALSPSKATTYRGNGKFFSMFGGCMFERPLTDQELSVANKIRAKYKASLGDMYITAGTDRGKPIWVAQIQQGYDVDSVVSIEDLEKQVEKWYDRQVELGKIR